MSRIQPCIWYDNAAEEAAAFYVSLLPNSRIDRVQPSPVDTPGCKAGDVLVVVFTLDGQSYMGLNGGPGMPHSFAMSLTIYCDTQAEIDRLWSAILANGGKEIQCGWIADKWGVNWQIIPSMMPDLIADPARGARAMEAMFDMVKLDIATLESA